LGIAFTHIFSSTLQRAAKTAALIREAQSTPLADKDAVPSVPVAQLPLLVEQDFGFREGKKFYERPFDSKSTGKEHHRQEHKDTIGFADVESKQSIAQRADAFLDDHLLPLLEGPTQTTNHTVAVVSHGILLSVLWKRLLRRLPPRSVRFAPEVVPNTRGPTLEHLGGWSNTGYLELHMLRVALHGPSGVTTPAPRPTPKSAPSEAVSGQASEEATDGGVQAVTGDLTDTAHEDDNTASLTLPSVNPTLPPAVLRGWQAVIETANGRDHLKGLKRTRGGVGSSRYDASQKSIDSFFKKRRVE
jgi:broad specificity phosphatase PhoE